MRNPLLGALALQVIFVADCGAAIPASAMSCVALPVASGPEDFSVSRSPHGGPELLVAAFDRRSDDRGNGGIYALPITDSGPGAARLLPTSTSDGNAWPGDRPFQPLGIATYTGSLNAAELLAVNTADPPSIERFVRTADGLTHLSTWSSPLLVSPNDIVAVSDDDFYVTNSASANGFAKYWQWGLRQTTGNVLHYRASTQKWTVVETGLKFANGIAYAKELEQLFIGEFNARRVRVYQRFANGNLHEIDSAGSVLDAYPDNLTWISPQHLYIAAHHSALRSFCHVLGWCRTAPARIFLARYAAPESAPVVSEIAVQGEPLPAAAAAIEVYRDWTFISQLVRPEIFACQRADSGAENG